LVFIAGNAFALDKTIDCRSGMYIDIITFRSTRIALNDILPDVSARFVNGTYNGMGLLGNGNNFRLGLQGIYNPIKVESKVKFLPFAGFSLSGSDSVESAVSLDAGFDFSYSWLTWVSPVVGTDVMFYNGSSMVDYYMGTSFSLKKSRNWFSFDLLLSGLYLTGHANKTGIALRLNFQMD